jgi:RNA polymerase sigma-70 factor (ECF subfamily)
MEQPRTRSEELAAHWAKSQPLIAVFVASIVTNVHDADDILQNVALVTARKFDQYDRNRSFVAWAIGIARNEILKYYEDRRTTIISVEAIEQIAQVCDSETLRGLDTTTDRMQALRLCMERLKTRWRTVLEMHYLRELSPARIAQQLDMSQANVFVILHRVRVALRECVEQRLRQENL